MQQKTTNVSTHNALVKDIAETVKNPILLTMVGGNWSLIQSKIVESILVQIQDQIEEKLVRHDMGFVLSDADIKDGLVEMDIPIKSLGIPNQKYGELDAACEAISKIQNIYEELDTSTGEYGKVWKNIFHTIYLPKSTTDANGDKLQYKNGVRNKGIIKVQMVAESAREILSLRKGYTEHLLGVPQLCRSPRTPRLYAFLSAWRDKGQYDFPYLDLKEWCGAAKLNKSRTKVIEGSDKYQKFSEFKRCVLDPAQKELKKLADNNDVDFYFEFTPIYPQGTKTGNPLSVLFTIIPSERGRLSFEERFLRDVHSRLIRDYGLTPDEWHVLEQLIKGLAHESVNAKIKSIASDMQKYIPAVPHAYLTKQLAGWAKVQEKVIYAEFEEMKKEDKTEPSIDPRWEQIRTAIQQRDPKFFEVYVEPCSMKIDQERVVIVCPSTFVIEQWQASKTAIEVCSQVIKEDFFFGLL